MSGIYEIGKNLTILKILIGTIFRISIWLIGGKQFETRSMPMIGVFFCEDFLGGRSIYYLKVVLSSHVGDNLAASKIQLRLFDNHPKYKDDNYQRKNNLYFHILYF